jgi:hypothetical protein
MIINDTIVQASFTIVTYDRKNIFTIQATGGSMGYRYVLIFLKWQEMMKIVTNSANSKAREKTSTDLISLEFQKF